MAVLDERGAAATARSLAPPLDYPAAADIYRTTSGLTVMGDATSWFMCHNGFRPGLWSRLFPQLDPLSVQGMVDSWQTMLREYPAPPGYPRYSGYPAFGFVAEYLPIAERDGYFWVVDIRPGDRFNQVLAFDKVDADDNAVSWPSAGHLLVDLTTAIETGTEFDGWLPSVSDGELTWSLSR
ncbi:MAG: hypothetical protein WBF79_11515 [Rhodococcus sp. (in: high G+C Gram-positive bacteria)]